MRKSRLLFKDRLHITRLENTVGSGTPDVEGSIDGAQFWVELKTAARPARSTTKVAVKIQPSQPIWISKRLKSGFTNIYVLLQVGSGLKDTKRYLIPGSFISKLDGGMTEEAIAKASIQISSPKQLIKALSLKI